MVDYLHLSPVPIEEPCQQVPYAYPDLARKECLVFIEQLRRVFGPEPEGARLRVKACPHDFGTYYDVIVQYDDTIEEAVEYAFNLENNLPESWDEEARKALESDSMRA